MLRKMLKYVSCEYDRLNGQREEDGLYNISTTTARTAVWERNFTRRCCSVFIFHRHRPYALQQQQQQYCTSTTMGQCDPDPDPDPNDNVRAATLNKNNHNHSARSVVSMKKSAACGAIWMRRNLSANRHLAASHDARLHCPGPTPTTSRTGPRRLSTVHTTRS